MFGVSKSHTAQMPAFNPYEYLARVEGDVAGEPILLSDQFRESDVGTMLKAALRAIEMLSERVRELEQKPR